MESRLPKPSGIKRPMAGISKTILPMDRMKSSSTVQAFGSSTFFRMPLTRDLNNFQHSTNSRPFKGGSPELPRRSPINRSKLRRSRSACDIRDMSEFIRPLKRIGTALETIPSKSARFGNTNATATASLTTKPSTSRTDTSRTLSFRAKKDQSSSSNLSNNSVKTGTGITKKPIQSKAPVSTKPTINKRIPPYDYKARFADLTEKHKVLKDKFDQSKKQLAEFDSLPEQFEESQNELFMLRDELKKERTEVKCLQKQSHTQSTKITSLTNSLKQISKDYETIKEVHTKMAKEHTSMSKELIEVRSNNINLTESVEFLNAELEISKDQLFRANMERKELHNTIMDLRGNIRVFCRVRPPLEYEQDQLICGWNYLDECSLEIINLELANSNVKNKIATHGFNFDHVFHPKSTQEDVFEMVSPLIQSALDGYNICIFAYGQTGSGKTYTMDGANDQLGVIPRTVDLLFQSIGQYQRLGWNYEIKATFLEIYNEVLYDLLSNEQKDMEIRMLKNSKNDIYVSNITEENVVNANHLRQLMHIARQNRATAATAGNERSSRSHAVTRIELIGKHEAKSEVSIGTINLVDLAGSESPKTSIRMAETKNINRSLSELTNVILALLQKQDHIPYRNSKLTHLLMPSLGGNSKTLMFINVAPFQDCYGESLKSLRFAQSVNSCKLAKAKKNKFLNVSGSCQ